MESRYANNWQDTSDSVVASENSEHLQKVLDDNVEQISSVRNQYYINYKLYNILNEHYNFFYSIFIIGEEEFGKTLRCDPPWAKRENQRWKLKKKKENLY